MTGVMLGELGTDPWREVHSPTGTFWVPLPSWVSGRGMDLLVRDGGGGGPGLVLIHGWCADGLLNWAPLFAPLRRQGWRVLTIDMPGHGGSRDGQPFSLDRCVEAVELVLDRLVVGPVVIGGYSMGGPISQLLARDRPEQVVGLIEMATAAHLVPRGLLRGGLLLWTTVWANLARLAGTPGTSPLGPPVGSGDDHGMVQHAGWALRSHDHVALSQAGKAIAEYDSREWVGSLGVPASSVITVRDHLVPRLAQAELARLLRAEVFDVDHGHSACTQIDFTDQVLAATATHYLLTRRVNSRSGPVTAGPTSSEQ